jgi:hypothetical protein
LKKQLMPWALLFTELQKTHITSTMQQVQHSQFYWGAATMADHRAACDLVCAVVANSSLLSAFSAAYAFCRWLVGVTLHRALHSRALRA